MSEQFLKAHARLIKEEWPELSLEQIEEDLRRTDERLKANRIHYADQYKLERYDKQSLIDFVVKDGLTKEYGEELFGKVYNNLQKIGMEPTEELTVNYAMAIIRSGAELAAMINAA